MYLSPINYQMGMMQSASLKKSNSPNFKNKDAKNINELPTVKNMTKRVRCKK